MIDGRTVRSGLLSHREERMVYVGKGRGGENIPDQKKREGYRAWR